MEKYRKQCADKGLPTDDEIVVLFAMFPQQVEALLKPKSGPAACSRRRPQPRPRDRSRRRRRAVPSQRRRGANSLSPLNGRRHEVEVETLQE